MQNVEFKCELRDINLARAILRATGATFIAAFDQTDTYYKVTDGRLKRRETPGEETEYIFYERPNEAGPKISSFTIYSERQATERFGREPLPTWLVVKKRRELHMLGSTRIHLDQVEGLGQFLELESLVSREHPTEQARIAVTELRKALSPVLGEAIDCGYSDLLAADADGGRRV